MNLSKVCKGVRQLKKYGPFLAIFFIALAFLMPHLFTHKLILGADALFSFPLWIPAKWQDRECRLRPIFRLFTRIDRVACR